ncbi:hypothetical protein U9R90_26900 [Streptomyces sp. E11-3]|uniref:hypothetical protein n=1 Tax=Streptomyces sp. E11-3 TaxID=3110112 RepID=UPI0039809D33
MAWERAFARAGHIAAAALAPGEEPRDDTAVRDLLAIVLEALGDQSGGPEQVGLGSLLWHLRQPIGHLRALVEPLGDSGLTAAVPQTTGRDSRARTWLWLTHTEANAPQRPEESRGEDGTAVDAAARRAAEAVMQSLADERPGLPNALPVTVIDGEHTGRSGTVRGPAWLLDDDRRDIVRGYGPPGYHVRLEPEAADVVVLPGSLAALLDEDQWEQAHHDTYQEASWERVERLAWALTQRHIGYSADDLEGYAAGEHTPEARSERETKWLPASRLLALALWRAARNDACLVDEVPLHRALWWLGHRHGGPRDLYARPLPPWGDPSPVTGSWQRLKTQDAERRLQEAARWIVAWHTGADADENRRLRAVADGSYEPPLLLGDRYRAVTSGPFRDGTPPRWTTVVDLANTTLAKTLDHLRSSQWQPGQGARRMAADLHPTVAAGPDPHAPPLPDGVDGPAWIQRAVRLEHIYTTIRTLWDHYQGDADVRTTAPFGGCLGTVTVALQDFLPSVHSLEASWEHRAQPVGVWERCHMPVALREHVLALEQLVGDLCELCFYMTLGPDEPH